MHHSRLSDEVCAGAAAMAARVAIAALVGMCSSALLFSFCLTHCAGSGLLSDAAFMSDGNDNVQLVGVDVCCLIPSANQ